MTRDNTGILDFLESEVELNRHGGAIDRQWNAALFYNFMIDENPKITSETSVETTTLREITLVKRSVGFSHPLYTLELKGAACEKAYGKLYAYFAYDEHRDCLWFWKPLNR